MLNWIVWNRTVLHLIMCKKKLYLYKIEFFEIELFLHLTVCKQMIDLSTKCV